jgi:2'-5' RNA ligase
MRAQPVSRIATIRAMLREVIGEVLGPSAIPDTEQTSDQESGFTPHITLAYSNSEGPIRPVIDAVRSVERHTVTITVSTIHLLSIDRGTNSTYQWTELAAATLGPPASHSD